MGQMAKRIEQLISENNKLKAENCELKESFDEMNTLKDGIIQQL